MPSCYIIATRVKGDTNPNACHACNKDHMLWSGMQAVVVHVVMEVVHPPGPPSSGVKVVNLRTH